jgi:hypothetical protein
VPDVLEFMMKLSPPRTCGTPATQGASTQGERTIFREMPGSDLVFPATRGFRYNTAACGRQLTDTVELCPVVAEP